MGAGGACVSPRGRPQGGGINGDTLYSIGELARQTGTTVKTIRFCSDSGIVSPADRTPAGHRQYGDDALARLELVRTLRDLGLGLPAIRQLTDRERELPEVAAAQAEALDAQIRMDCPGPNADGWSTTFLEAVFGSGRPGADTAFRGVMRSMTPELPEDPRPDQIEAWVELAELSQDPDFRDHLRQMAQEHAADGWPGPQRPGPALGWSVRALRARVER